MKNVLHTYRVSRDETVLIYGGGVYGVGCASAMLERGYNVAGIIDRAPEGVNDAPVPVFLPDEALSQFGNGVFVFVGLARGTNHMEIALMLSGKGYGRFLCLPFWLGGARAKAMTAAYNSFFTGDEQTDIPYYDDLFILTPDDYVMNETSGFVTAWISKEHLFADFSNTVPAIDNPYFLHTTLPYVYDDLLTKEDIKVEEGLLEKTGTGTGIIPNFRKPLYTWNAFYRKGFEKRRKELCVFLEQAFNNSIDYFTRIPSPVTLSECGNHWFILDGHHRSAFLLLKGFNTIPICAKREEWETYFRAAESQALMDIVKMSPVLPYMIPHPAFSLFPVKALGYENLEETAKLLKAVTGFS